MAGCLMAGKGLEWSGGYTRGWNLKGSDKAKVALGVVLSF